MLPLTDFFFLTELFFSLGKQGKLAGQQRYAEEMLLWFLLCCLFSFESLFLLRPTSYYKGSFSELAS